MVLHCWLRRAGCISQDTYLLYKFPNWVLFSAYCTTQFPNTPAHASVSLSQPTNTSGQAKTCVSHKMHINRWQQLDAMTVTYLLEVQLLSPPRHQQQLRQPQQPQLLQLAVTNLNFQNIQSSFSCKRPDQRHAEWGESERTLWRLLPEPEPGVGVNPEWMLSRLQWKWGQRSHPHHPRGREVQVLFYSR